MGRLHLFIRGRVQGVFFRTSAQERAQELGVVGWVRNCVDGSVELVAEGPPEQLALLRDWSRRGPPGAFVESVKELKEAETGEFSDFHLRAEF